MLLRAAIYVAALIPIMLIYGTKARGLFTAVPIGLLAFGATWLLLRSIPNVSERRRLLHAGVVGLILAQFAWALGSWAVIPLVGGAALWLALYALSGVAQHNLEEDLDRHIAIEYAAVAGLGALIVLASAPWRP